MHATNQQFGESLLEWRLMGTLISRIDQQNTETTVWNFNINNLLFALEAQGEAFEGSFKGLKGAVSKCENAVFLTVSVFPTCCHATSVCAMLLLLQRCC